MYIYYFLLYILLLTDYNNKSILEYCRITIYSEFIIHQRTIIYTI